jgi:Flp pilus assembly pilin Flp
MPRGLTASDRFGSLAFRGYWAARDVGDRATHRLRRLLDGEAGQTSSEHVVFVGMMAAIIIALFGVIFVPQVRQAVSTLKANMLNWVSSTRTK